MFNLFKRNTEDQPLDVKMVREHILQFIKDELQKSEGGEGASIDTLKLFAAPPATDRHLYEAAIYVSDQERLKQELQRIADNFAVNLPADWKLEVIFQDQLPDHGIHYKELPISLTIENKVIAVVEEPVVHTQASIQVMTGTAEHSSYRITSKSGRVNIGREKNTSTSNGAIRVNQIAFPDDSEAVGNKYVSRQHAHLEWDDKKHAFMLFADEGGIPPGNKTKVQSEGEESQVKLNSAQVGHLLKDGDQLIIGESVILKFNYLNENQLANTVLIFTNSRTPKMPSSRP